MEEAHTEKATHYWDVNRERVNDPVWWTAHPVCRRAINRRVTGSSDEWPLDWFKRVHAPVAFGRGISWGCGLGPFERSAIRIGLVEQIDAFDVSSASLADARRLAAEEGLTGIRYDLGNFDDPEIPAVPYDIAFFHASLHHVGALERLFRRLTLILKPGGVVYVDEFIGPSRNHWNSEKLRLAEAVLKMVPKGERLRDTIDFPIVVDDPSEAIRSAEIESFLRDFFDISIWRPYGGQLASMVLPYVSPQWALSPAGHEFIEAILELEDCELARDPTSTFQVVAFGRIKSIVRLAPQLLEQAGKAIGRRLARALHST